MRPSINHYQPMSLDRFSKILGIAALEHYIDTLESFEDIVFNESNARRNRKPTITNHVQTELEGMDPSKILLTNEEVTRECLKTMLIRVPKPTLKNQYNGLTGMPTIIKFTWGFRKDFPEVTTA